MKKIVPGWFGPEGYCCECKYCTGKFLVENRQDVSARVYHGRIFEHELYYEYYAICPFCGFEQCLGNTQSDYAFVNREDFKERFSLENNGLNINISNYNLLKRIRINSLGKYVYE